MRAVELKEVSFSYGDRKALDQLSFAVGEGQLFGVVGPNGGGKSTLFGILSTRLTGFQGSVALLGIDVARQPARVRREIGVIFQFPALDKKLSVEENIVAQGYLYGLSGAVLKDRVSAVLSRLNLADRKKERVETLSGGLRRRVEIAKGILHQPKVLLMDEPTTGLDPLVRKELWDYVRSLVETTGLTVLLTTHQMEEAELCKEIALIDQGSLIALGTPNSLKDSLGTRVMVARASDPQSLQQEMKQKWQLESRVLGDEVRFDTKLGVNLPSELLHQLSERADTVTVGRPTLEDFFIAKTGRRLEQGGTA